MNILHVIESLEFGGAEQVVIQLANRFAADDNNNVSICTTKRIGELIMTVNPEVSLFHLNGKEGNDFSIIWKLKTLICRNNIEILHIHNWGVYVEAIIAAKFSGICKIIHTVHGPYRSYNNYIVEHAKIFIRHRIEKILSIFVYKFVAVSDAIKDYMICDIGINSKKIVVVRNGVRALKRQINHTNNESTILKLVSVGRIAKIKNHRFMLDGLKLVSSSNINIKLTIVGDGPELNNIRDYTHELELDPSVDFLGFRSDIETILEDKDVFIMTSEYEGISIALLEAMRVGLPAIATRVGGIPETVIDGKTGILVKPKDTAALASAIEMMFNNKQIRRSMGQKAYEHFMAEFNEDIVIEKYKYIYRH